MDTGKSFSFPFEDNQWLSKFGIGAFVTMIPILNFAWSGYMVELIRNVMNGSSQPLPNWDDLGKKLSDGLILFAAGLIYSLPILVVACLPLSMMVIPGMLSGNQDTQGIANAITGVSSVLFVGLLCLFVTYGLVLSVIYPAILVLYAREGTFASCFKFREVFDLIGKNMGPFFTAWGVSIAASLIVGLVAGFAQIVLNFIPCIGQIISLVLTVGIVVYTSAIYAHLFGQFGQIAFERTRLIPADQAI
jgi:hypothetical protein